MVDKMADQPSRITTPKVTTISWPTDRPNKLLGTPFSPFPSVTELDSPTTDVCRASPGTFDDPVVAPLSSSCDRGLSPVGSILLLFWVLSPDSVDPPFCPPLDCALRPPKANARAFNKRLLQRLLHLLMPRLCRCRVQDHILLMY